MSTIFSISMNSLFPVLFWGNAISFVFLLVYCLANGRLKERWMLVYLLLARLCQAFHYFTATGRGILPDWLSVNLGNTLLLVGLFFEAQAIMCLIKEDNKRRSRFLLAVLACMVLVFNLVEWTVHTGGSRIVTTSLGNIAIMLVPVVFMLFSRAASVFTRITAGFYSVFLLFLLGRVWNGLQNQAEGVLNNSALNSITFLVLLLQVMVSLPAYVLILKDYADEALVLMATTDHLTGATNRHAFLGAATAIFENSQRFQLPLAVLFLDIDHFKEVNDKYGHAFGDRVLSRLAMLIDDSLRGSDMSCRYGGDEFVVLLPRADHAVAKLVAQRIMKEVHAVHFEGTPDYALTVSLGGYCGVPQPGQAFSEIIQAADKAMYHAKRVGRNRAFLVGARPEKHVDDGAET